jgi:hypothetical protein
MSKSDLARATRATKRQRTLGAEATCEECGCDDAAALTKTDGRVRCYECRCAEHGKATVEAHHHLGRAVDPSTVPVPGNLHRDLSDRQYDWPPEVRTNPQRDPLLWLAAACLGLRDHLGWWVAWLDRIARWLITLSKVLRETHGEQWGTALGLPPVWQAVTP